MDIKLIMVIVGGLVIHLLIAVGFQLQRGGRLEDHKTELSDLEREWSRDDDATKQKREQELQEKYGTTKLDRIAYDPRMDLRLTLERMFKELAPDHFEVSVTVDRFTEYRVLVKSNNLPPLPKLANWLKEVFSRVAPQYVYQIIFTDGDRYIIVGREDLERVGDFSNASEGAIVGYALEN